jgi:E3 ubiquitin-protein ligase NEDD4
LYPLKTNHRRNNDITDALELTFATDDERFGETVSIELKPGGDNIEVTNENKGEYVEYVHLLRHAESLY